MQGLEIADRRNHAPTRAWALQMRSWLSMLKGDTAAVMVDAREILELAERLGFKTRISQALFIMGRANTAAGNTEQGIPQLREGCALWASAGGKFHCSELASYAADVLMQTGRSEGALEYVLAGEAVQRDTDECFMAAELLRLRGGVFELQHASEAAEQSYRSALEVSLRNGAALFALRAGNAIARLRRATGREAEAKAILAPLVDSFPEPMDWPEIRAIRSLLL